MYIGVEAKPEYLIGDRACMIAMGWIRMSSKTAST
jgi:hypothetical protein